MPKTRNRGLERQILALLRDPAKLSMAEIAGRVGTSLTMAYWWTANLRQLGHAIPDRRWGRKGPRRRRLPAEKPAPRPRRRGPSEMDRETIARRIEAWTKWQARRRERGLPAAGKPYFGLDRILSRNERRAEA